MTRVLTLSVLLALAPVSAPATAAAVPGTCTAWTDRSRPPKTIRVFRLHRRGSSVPARVEVVPFRTYVERVMVSGGWPASKPMASLRVGAIAIRQYAEWHIRHPQPGYRLRGECYDIRDGDQLYRPPWRIHSKVRRAVESTWGIRLVKGGRRFRTGWTGTGGRCGQVVDGWHVFEDGVTDCARRGWTWRRIIERYLSPVRILGKLR